MKKNDIVIPNHLKFSDLKLTLEPDGQISCDSAIVELICDANGFPIKKLSDYEILELLVRWYLKHRQKGGKIDAVAEGIIT